MPSWKNLQNQVAYTITLNLEVAVSGSAPQRAFGSQMQLAWNNSTHYDGRILCWFNEDGYLVNCV